MENNTFDRYEERVVFNIRGVIFETYTKTLRRFPCTLLGNRRSRNAHFCPQTNQHFFDRIPVCFESILYLYQSNGRLNCPMGFPLSIFEEECEFFELPEDIINKMKMKEGIFPNLDNADDETKVGDDLRSRVWNILEEPTTSLAARVYAVISLSFIFLSIITCCMETMPLFKSQSRMWGILESALNTWFVIEYILRLASCKCRLPFLQNTMNIIDVAAALPYFILQAINTNKRGLIGILKTLKFFRVFRLFRLSKQSRRLQVVGRILLLNVNSFKIYLLGLMMLAFAGGVSVYLMEVGDRYTDFSSIPASLWWSTITITSVGYGDIVPRTIPGRICAGIFMMFGILTISLPVLTIVLEITELYPKNMEMENHLKAKGGNEVADGSRAGSLHQQPSVVGVR